jgi:hypothetical protein
VIFDDLKAAITVHQSTTIQNIFKIKAQMIQSVSFQAVFTNLVIFSGAAIHHSICNSKLFILIVLSEAVVCHHSVPGLVNH